MMGFRSGAMGWSWMLAGVALVTGLLLVVAWAAQRRRSAQIVGVVGGALVVIAIVIGVLGSWGPLADWSRPMGPAMTGGVMTERQAGPGSLGFVPGTVATPRAVRILAGPGYLFSPSEVRIVAGETIRFQVTAMGPSIHEFKVGPAAEVAADSEAAPEIGDLGVMTSKSLTYTFAGSGPFAFACHEPGHFEAGMQGLITIVS